MENSVLNINPEEYGFDNFVRIIPSYAEQYRPMVIPERFYKRVLCHVLSHYLENNHFFEPPVFLAIEGDAGEGKTSQAIASCTQKGVTVLYISGSNLSGNHESDAKNKLEEVYNRAVQLKESGHFIAIVIDDFHKSIATEDKNITRTINTNLLVGYMMNLAENTGRTQVPIILTANDISDIYSPLLRLGRADVFKWSPTIDEKKSTIRTILNTFVMFASDKEFDSFFDKNKHESISFFAQLKNKYRMNVLEQIINQTDKINSTTLASINSHISSHLSKIRIDELNSYAQKQRLERSKKA